VLQEKWVLHIVHALLDGPRGFNELGRDVGGCNPTTLRQRLVALQDVGLVTRHGGEEGAARATYALTPAGEGLRDVIAAIHTWSLQHLHSTRAPRPAPTDVGRGQVQRRPAGPPAHEGVGAPIAVEAAGTTDGS
jgi:DNA-binding HxlR family transcriptional regulator